METKLHLAIKFCLKNSGKAFATDVIYNPASFMLTIAGHTTFKPAQVETFGALTQGTSVLHSENDATFPTEFSVSQRGPFFGPLFYVDFCHGSSVAVDH